MAAHQAPPSLGFSRQEYWSGLLFHLQCMRVKSESEVVQSCPTLCDPMDCSPPGSSIHGIFQARVLEWVAISLSNAPNIGAPQYTRQTLTDIKGEIDSNTIIIGDFYTPLTPMDRSSKQKINKKTQVLNDTLDEMISLISSGHPIQMQKNTPSSQVHMEHSPG